MDGLALLQMLHIVWDCAASGDCLCTRASMLWSCKKFVQVLMWLVHVIPCRHHLYDNLKHACMQTIRHVISFS